jgi:enhancing lycopene biosynthesis protein 2
MNRKVAVLLCGSGFKDGSEIRESVLTLLALSQQDVDFQCFAPNDWQKDVVNCLTGESVSERRNMLVEAARIARGDVKDLNELNPKDFHSLIIPGGYGVAKNLCTFAFEGSRGQVRHEAMKAINGFYELQKPIGAICIAPALVAMALKGKNIELTLGAEGEAAQEVSKLGHRHKAVQASECVIDRTHKIVTTPAYMYERATMADIFQGISLTVKEVLSF